MIQYVAELWRWGDLLFWLAAKEIKVRYKLPILGFLWALLVPLLTSLILWLVFGYLIPVSPSRYPFFLFLMTGMFPWSLFAQSVSQATMSILDSSALIKKTAFPRAMIPLSVVAANGFNFLLALLVVLGIVLAWQRTISGWLWLLPIIVILELVFTAGLALLVAGLQVRYRDVKYLIELGLLLWFYLTPVFYTLDAVLRGPSFFRKLFFLNPFVHFVELYRLAFLGGSSAATFLSPIGMLGMAIASSLTMAAIGLAVFRHHEPTFADWVTG